MQTPFTNHANFSPDFGEASPGQVDRVSPPALGEAVKPTVFHGAYVGRMDMAADLQTVAQYLDVHQDWFCRCADPMAAEPLGDNGYAVTVGHFGAMGYDIEPRIGLHLLPQDHGVYRIETIPVPGYTPQGYDVDFRAALELKEMPDSATGQVMTQVEWTLDLDVAIAFPKFLNALPKALLLKTGNALLNQVVRQASRCLTHKVQDDFHTTLNIALPESLQNRSHHFLERLSKGLHLNS
ncbi:MAG: DUF1997 domain-containing protein [Cyanobacteria bacterium]|nr:DUF1997 domain-containing protein [Cyanobacteriota bacterium]MDA0866027.1 DUF1997 domain-containing protein [Cyanobacteriota bacterium]